MAKKRFTKVIKKAKAKKVKKARHFNKNNNPDLLSRVQYRRVQYFSRVQYFLNLRSVLVTVLSQNLVRIQELNDHLAALLQTKVLEML